MRLLISFAALLLSVLLLQMSTGGVGPLDALSALKLDFTPAEIGLLGSAHFVGFFIGCWWAPRLMGSVGHSRAFAALTAAGAIGLLAPGPGWFQPRPSAFQVPGARFSLMARGHRPAGFGPRRAP